MISLDFLEKVEIFKGLNDDQLAVIQSCCEEKEFQRGDKLFDEGEDATHLYMMTGGEVDLRLDSPETEGSDERTLSSISETMAFGRSSLVPPYKMTLSCYCASRVCRVARVDSKKLLELFEKDTRLGYSVMSNLATVMSKRFHKLQNKIAKRRGEEMMSNW
ncbi:Crp/Fnr family transcriptional regulator [Desulfonema magnum]|uniref:Cyclic nucleotide-binding domain-containing protein n=1 Tax=Desulfonema magnum TaxID=45655 RepID=A0A975BM04_9BACT|nr:cyclic nucleotide-binding domain-containing protein [Desulfonema magnum]QTA88159.1 Cyclic nucleotide-binding domain-containing protein [Desulfonema magnum]